MNTTIKLKLFMSRHFMTLVMLFFVHMMASAADHTTFLTSERGYTEVKQLTDIVSSVNDYYLLVSAENTGLIVGVGPYEAKPDWASGQSKALRYISADSDPALEESNFFTIEKATIDGTDYIGLRNVFYCTDMFQTHDNAGYMYINTYTDKTFDEWSRLIPSFQNGYWLFESGKYPMSSGNWACGFLGPWNKSVAAGEPIALNRQNVEGDDAGHYRLFHISKADLTALRRQLLADASTDHPANATWLITNPSFETGNETGWTLNGKDPNGNDEFKTRNYDMSNKDGMYLMNAYQWWAPSLNTSQTVENVPSGIYDLSAVVCTWENRTVTFTGNETTISKLGINDATGIPVSMTLTIGNDQKLNISAGSTGQWWETGHEGETQTFFKLDDVRLVCKGVFLNGVAIPLPNDEVTLLQPNQWYYYDVDYPSEYLLIGNITDMVCSTDGDQILADVTTSAPQREMTLSKRRIYFKTTREDATLHIAPAKTMKQGNFTAVALNVDGLPNTIAGIYQLNEDGPGSDGTKKISTYIASKGYDLVGASEDFNYNGSLIQNLGTDYGSGIPGNSISAENINTSLRFDTDGLNILWKKSTLSIDHTNLTEWKQSATQWDYSKSGEGNQFVKKGFRHYDVTILDNDNPDGYMMDVYILHMDAGSDQEYITSREGQWSQLAGAINNSDPNRPKLIIGDTNSRWTREEIAANFTNKLSSDLTMGDVWVELCRNNIYPTTAMDDLTDQSDPANFTNYEVVDKIIYINPKAANTLQLIPQSFWIEQDYTYDYVDHNGNTDPLGDHRPVVVNFAYMMSGDEKPLELEIIDNAENSKTIADYSGVTANVTLKDRTLNKGGVWNTLCLPFSLNQNQLANSPLSGATIKTLVDASVTGYHVELTFGDNLTSIAAGTPYIIKWEGGDIISDIVFEDVVLETATEADRTISLDNGRVKFIGYYDAFTIQKEENPTLYYLTANNQLNYTLKERMLNACRAYFLFAANVANQALDFTIDFGSGMDAIEEISNLETQNSSPQLWYTIDGQLLNGAPTTKGIFIHNGQKVVVK